ncbi:MAG: amidohydrolase [Chloroflexota bacterium]|nr:amidohydrolase [Chloroflexota bacterium]
MPADLIFVNGPIITVDDARPEAEAVAVLGNRIVQVGSDADVRLEAGRATRIVDLGGRPLLPGINDNHTHPMAFGESLSSIDATPGAAPTLAVLQDAFRRAAAKPIGSGAIGVAGDGWLQGRGYDDTRLDVHRHPTRYDLDEATGNRPAVLVRTCGHLAVANSVALARAGVTRATSDPVGGQVDRDESGEPTGLLRETAMGLVRSLVPKPTRAQIKTHLRAAGARFLSYGITSVGEAAIRTSEELAAYQELARDGELPMRVFTMMLIDDTLEPLAKLGLQTGFGSDWLRLGPAKLFQDGSGGGRTAAMSVDYRNDPGNRGITIYDQEGLNERFARAHRAGFQLSAHAIGDRAITMILDAYERAFGADPAPARYRARIEHAGMCTSTILDRMERLGIVAVPQPAFVHYLGDSYLENFTTEQLALSYPARAWLDRGIVAAGSSDVPVVPCDPFVNLRAAVTRCTQDGNLMGPDQKVTVEEAIRMFTRNGAYGSFEEQTKGSIAPGMLADFVVLDRDPRRIPPEELHTLHAEMTVIDGKIVHEA